MCNCLQRTNALHRLVDMHGDESGFVEGDSR